ncbi:unnamed protein product, partial [Tilletia laevis]
ITGAATSSYKVECPAKIKIEIAAPLRRTVAASTSSSVGTSVTALGSASPSSLPGPSRDDSIVKVEYYWKHEGHEPGSLADMAKQRNCQPVRDWIETQVKAGRTVNQIMGAARLSLEQLRSVSL